jgi:3',5'-nucleoside bisphosphate phosphatase
MPRLSVRSMPLPLAQWNGFRKRESFIPLNEPPPILVVEFVSPSAVTVNYRTKHSEYSVLAIPEYWIVNPLDLKVTICVLEDGAYSNVAKPLYEGSTYMLELHSHTTCSDGTLTPAELVRFAVEKGVKALAITDHDTMAGWEEAIATAAPLNLEIVPGLELSTVYNERSMHILGFYPDAEKLRSPLHERVEGRKRRACKMAEKLAELGYPITLPDMSGSMAPGRPHIASALKQAGHVKSSNEAFDRFLKDDGPAYVPYEKFTAEEGIALLLSCGAVPVWAHPYIFRAGTVETILPELVKAGLMGIEVYHPTHSASQTRKLEEYCQRYGLLATGGSDYHGPKKEKNPDFRDLNDLAVPLSLLLPLKAAAAKLKRARF